MKNPAFKEKLINLIKDEISKIEKLIVDTTNDIITINNSISLRKNADLIYKYSLEKVFFNDFINKINLMKISNISSNGIFISEKNLEDAFYKNILKFLSDEILSKEKMENVNELTNLVQINSYKKMLEICSL